MAESTLIISAFPGMDTAEHASFDSTKTGKQQAVPVAAEHPDAHQLANCGRTDSEHEVRIVHPDTNEELPENQIGEIWFKGPSVAKGYWQKEELSRETFEARLSNGEGPFLKTGDLGFLTEGICTLQVDSKTSSS